MEKPKYPIGIQTFSEIIEGNYTYVDKTEYENMMYLVMKLMGFYVQTEYKTSDGRIDMVVRTDRYIYVMEFKLHGTAEEAMVQIHEKEYSLPFVKESRKLILIGAAFSDETRRLEDWKIESV